MENTKRKRAEGNIVIFEDLDIYNKDTAKDKKINNKLVEFLNKKGIKLPKIKIQNH